MDEFARIARETVEDCLADGHRMPTDLLDVAKNSRERFVARSAKRLVYASHLFNNGLCEISDVLGPLRNYLLTSQTQLKAEFIEVPEENGYGISVDAKTDSYFATFQLPSYVNKEFARQVFLAEVDTKTQTERQFNLATDAKIRQLTGFTQFKSVAQKLAVYGALGTPDGYTTLISLPTGGGKSLVTQTLAYQNDGLTIAIVPTVSLAIDQVRVAKKIIKSSTIDDEVFAYSSGVDPMPLVQAIRRQKAKLLFISPEAAINNPLLAGAISSASEKRYLKSIIIDEAHIVVDWGASFRVDYQCLECWRNNLLTKNPGIRTVLLSATFEEKCVDILKSFFAKDDEKWIEIRCDSLRHEPRFMHVQAKSHKDKDEKTVELIQKLPHPLIAYVNSPFEAEYVASLLKARGVANVRTFTGATGGSARRALIDAWSADEFEIMVATSAFGVGVDKSDVRTVLHLYVPQNPNAYYQELGRGGRDRLPCISAMCVEPSDVDKAFDRIAKKVLTTEKIIGRWNSMYHNPASMREKSYVYLDTSIKPNYSASDSFEDVPASEADINWNVYVLLFLRRNALIAIRDVIVRGESYIFLAEVQNDALRTGGKALEDLIAPLREKERDSYVKPFLQMRKALSRSESDCWSEMFFETYHFVSEYCAGCDEHSIPNISDYAEFPLKKRIEFPSRTLDKEQESLFAGTDDVAILSKREELGLVYEALRKYRLSAFVAKDESGIESYADQMDSGKNTLLLDVPTLKEIVRKRAYFYLSGIVAINYASPTAKEAFELLRYVLNSIGKQHHIKVIHIIEEDYVDDATGRRFTDYINGPIRPLYAL